MVKDTDNLQNARVISEIEGKVLCDARMFGEPGVYGVQALSFLFEKTQISIYVDGSDDSILCSLGKEFPGRHNMIEKNSDIWNKYYGKHSVFVWLLHPTIGNVDAVQIMFPTTDGGHQIVQLLAMSSCVRIFQLCEVDVP